MTTERRQPPLLQLPPLTAEARRDLERRWLERAEYRIVVLPTPVYDEGYLEREQGELFDAADAE